MWYEIFVGIKFCDSNWPTKIMKFRTPRKLPAIRYHNTIAITIHITDKNKQIHMHRTCDMVILAQLILMCLHALEQCHVLCTGLDSLKLTGSRHSLDPTSFIHLSPSPRFPRSTSNWWWINTSYPAQDTQRATPFCQVAAGCLAIWSVL